MGNVIGLMGESGSGKTTSLRTLDPQTTFYIDADKKGLSWKGWKKSYHQEPKVFDGNYYATDSPSIVKKLMEGINSDAKGQKFKTLVIDTLNGVMVAEEMRNVKVQGYGKWTDLAAYIYDIVDYALTMRDDLTVIIVFHSETVTEDTGYSFTRIKTNGRKLDKIVLESKLSTVLWAVVKDGQHLFILHDDRSTAKIPFGCFADLDEIPNNIELVIKELEE